MRRIIREQYGTVAVIIGTIIAAFLNLAGYLNEKQAMSCSFFVVAGLALSMIFSDLCLEKKLEQIEEKLKRQSRSQFISRKEHYKLLNQAVQNAHTSIWIMTIDKALSTKVIGTISERSIYYENLKKIIKEKDNIILRRIYGLPIEEPKRKEKIGWVLSDIQTFKNCSNVLIRVLDWKEYEGSFQPLSLQIVDNAFIGIVNMEDNVGIEGGGQDLYMEDENAVQYFRLYFKTVWEMCEELKTGNYINEELLERLQEKQE